MPTFDKASLLRNHQLYDDLVSIVSAFEWLFTEVASLAETVAHFERYPSVAHPGDGNETTPDFSVLFKDNTGLAGEIARFPTQDQGVDRLCTQIARYDGLAELPGPSGIVPAQHVDVLLIVPFDLGTAAVQRIIKERLDSDPHPYSPSARPCIVQFTRDSEKYAFQRLGDPANGRLREGDRHPAIGGWLEQNNIPVKADRFQGVKAARRFGNDTIDPLYLAAHLWVTEFAEQSEGQPRSGREVPLTVETATVAESLRTKYGKGTKADVDRAMDILAAARLAAPRDDGSWRVAWGEVTRRDRDESIVETLADRAAAPPKTGPITRMLKAEREAERDAKQGKLF